MRMDSPARWWLVALTGLLFAVGGCADSTGANTEENGNGSNGPGNPPDWEQLYREEVESLAAAFERENGQPPPSDVEFVRFIEHWEYGEVHSQCVREQGFDAQPTFDNGVTYEDVPPEQGLALHEAIYRCQVAYPVHPRYSLPWTEEMIRTLYDYYVDELVPCLIAEGYPSQEAPSWDSFLAGYNTEHQWVPYDVVSVDSEEEWQRINEVCPQSPPTEELFGTSSS